MQELISSLIYKEERLRQYRNSVRTFYRNPRGAAYNFQTIGPFTPILIEMCLQPSSCFQVCTPGAGGVGRTSSPSRVAAPQSWQCSVPTGGSSRAGYRPITHGLFPFSPQVFHCVHFECPEQQSSQKEENGEESGPGDNSPASQQLDPHALQAPSASSLPSSPGSNSRSPNRQHQ